MEVKPFSPAEAKAQKAVVIPAVVIQAVNELLAEHYSSFIYLKLRMVQDRVNLLRGSGFAENPLESWVWDFEDLYRAQGWKVTYNGPSIGESFDSHYLFEAPRNPSPSDQNNWYGPACLR